MSITNAMKCMPCCFIFLEMASSVHSVVEQGEGLHDTDDDSAHVYSNAD